MAKSGKCNVCSLSAELTPSGHLPNHTPKDHPEIRRLCPGSGSVPMPPEPKAVEISTAKKHTPEPKPKPDQEPVEETQQEQNT